MDPEDPDSGPDHSQNRIISSFYHFFVLPFLTINNPILKISSKFILKLCGSLDPEDPDSDPDHSKNRIICSLDHLGHLLKF